MKIFTSKPLFILLVIFLLVHCSKNQQEYHLKKIQKIEKERIEYINGLYSKYLKLQNANNKIILKNLYKEISVAFIDIPDDQTDLKSDIKIVLDKGVSDYYVEYFKCIDLTRESMIKMLNISYMVNIEKYGSLKRYVETEDEYIFHVILYLENLIITSNHLETIEVLKESLLILRGITEAKLELGKQLIDNEIYDDEYIRKAIELEVSFFFGLSNENKLFFFGEEFYIVK
jgi:hypothetical protein